MSESAKHSLDILQIYTCLPFPKQALLFTCLQYKSCENTVGKGEIARNEQFLLYPQRFLPVRRTFCHFNQILNCRLQTLSIWKSLKFVVWERVKHTVFFSLPNYERFDSCQTLYCLYPLSHTCPYLTHGLPHGLIPDKPSVGEGVKYHILS